MSVVYWNRRYGSISFIGETLVDREALQLSYLGGSILFKLPPAHAAQSLV